MPAITVSTKRKLSLLQLAEELGNVSKVCRIMGYGRDTFPLFHRGAPRLLRSAKAPSIE